MHNIMFSLGNVGTMGGKAVFEQRITHKSPAGSSTYSNTPKSFIGYNYRLYRSLYASITTTFSATLDTNFTLLPYLLYTLSTVPIRNSN
jgi:hypothetical protein